MMSKEGGKKNTTLLGIVEERAKLSERKNQLEIVAQSIPFLPQDCISQILLRLPIDSLQRSTCVCKLWCDMNHDSSLILSHTNHSETVILFQTPALKQHDGVFCVEDYLIKPTNLKSWPKFCIHFVEIGNGKGIIRDFNISCLGRITASCNGLILLENKMKAGGLILMNPVTRKLIALEVGTVSQFHKRSYSLVFDPCACEYKVVHLFNDESDYTSCEILVVGEKSWRKVNSAPFGLISWFGYKPSSAIGALHWLPHIYRNDYIVSMETATEEFRTIELPKSGRSCDTVFEMGGFLCFAKHIEKEIDQIDIWALKKLCDENWTRIHRVVGWYSLHMIPISGSRFYRQIIFTRNEDGVAALYTYDLQLKLMSKIEMGMDDCYLPHVNSLVSWEK